MSAKVKLPKHVTIGAYKVELVKIPHDIAYESSDYQGSFVSKPPLKIYLDEEIIGGNSNNVSAIVFGMGEESEDEMDELKAMGFTMLGEAPPNNWQAGILKE